MTQDMDAPEPLRDALVAPSDMTIETLDYAIVREGGFLRFYSQGTLVYDEASERAPAAPAGELVIPTRDFGDFATENVMAWIDQQLNEANAHDPNAGVFRDTDVGDALRWLRANLYGTAAPAGEPLSKHDREIVRDIEAMAADKSLPFWPQMLALGALRIIRQLEAALAAAESLAVAAPAGEPVAWMREPSTNSRTPVAITHWAKLNHGAKEAGGPGYTAEYTIPLYRAAPAGEPGA